MATALVYAWRLNRELLMKTAIALMAAALVAGCGVETATTAATSAEIKKREMEQAKNTMKQAQEKIDAAAKQVQIRTEQSGGDKQ
jgi:hypothetical protein